MIKQAARMDNIKLSRIREIMDYCKSLEKQGKTILNFTNGEPDFGTPDYIKTAAKKALDAGKTGYPSALGVEELRVAVAKKLLRENGLHYAPDEIHITNGVSQAMFLAIMSFVNEEDEILLPDPGYTNYFEVVKYSGAAVKKYSLKMANDFQIDIDELTEKITEKTKMILLISPNNPTGSVLTKETLEKVAELVREREIVVLSDEVYEKIIYDGREHHSIAGLPGMREKTIILNGFSKSYAMTGWRLGYAVAPRHYIDTMVRLNAITTCGVNHFVQWAGADALEQETDECRLMRDEYEKRRDYIVAAINRIDKLTCAKPDGAFYAFFDIRDTGMTSEEFVKYMIDEASVALVPGSAFGDEGEGFVRFCYAKPIDDISEALARMARALGKRKG